MKRPLLCLSLISITILTSIACSLGTVRVEGEPTPSNTAPSPLTDQLTSEVSTVPTETVSEGGFITGTPLDAATLPRLPKAGADGPSGGGAVQCIGEDTEPSITLRYHTLCLNNFPTAPDSPGFTVTLVDPAGHTFGESFTYSLDEIVNSRGIPVGRVQDHDDIEILLTQDLLATPGVYMDLYMPANLPSGDWLVSAKTQDGSIDVGPTTITLSEDDYQYRNVLAGLDTNPFIDSGRKSFTNNETIYFVGTGYSPNTAITTAFYQTDPSGEMFTAKYAVSVITDNQGSFQVQFIVGSTTLRGEYCGYAAPVITSDMWMMCNDARTDTSFVIE